MTKAFFIQTISIIDPDTGAPVELEVYKDEASAGLFAIDSSYLEQVLVKKGDGIPSPFNKSTIVELIDLDRSKNPRWPIANRSTARPVH